jgi:hypothetical protein
VTLFAATAVAGIICGCASKRFDPAKATKPYPSRLHSPDSIVDMQLFRKGSDIEIINSTATSYRDFDLWINQRYVRHVDALPAGSRITLSLFDFWDVRGESIPAGGPFRTLPPMPVRLAQIQTGDAAPLIGLISIPVIDDRVN